MRYKKPTDRRGATPIDGPPRDAAADDLEPADVLAIKIGGQVYLFFNWQLICWKACARVGSRSMRCRKRRTAPETDT